MHVQRNTSLNAPRAHRQKPRVGRAVEPEGAEGLLYTNITTSGQTRALFRHAQPGFRLRSMEGSPPAPPRTGTASPSQSVPSDARLVCLSPDKSSPCFSEPVPITLPHGTGAIPGEHIFGLGRCAPIHGMPSAPSSLPPCVRLLFLFLSSLWGTELARPSRSVQLLDSGAQSLTALLNGWTGWQLHQQCTCFPTTVTFLFLSASRKRERSRTKVL
ncbi:uncharacterized protein [Notamacropus eugenii]|uniref:uncharacterized protein n=1 Tax=Notamacropus eugenii TaxID=9315 RepID=UPI003B68613A